MAGRLPRLPGVVATVATAGEGYFFGYTIAAPVKAVGTLVAAVDRVMAYQFVLPFRAIINRILTEVTTVGGAGKLYSVGLYDSSKNLLVHTGALDANTVQKNETSVTLITLEPGIYWFAQTADTTTVQARATTTDVSFPASATTVRHGRAANASSTGVLPATLGAVSFDLVAATLAMFYRE